MGRKFCGSAIAKREAKCYNVNKIWKKEVAILRSENLSAVQRHPLLEPISYAALCVDIIPPVKFHRQFADFLRGKGSPPDIGVTIILAVRAVKNTFVCK